MVSVSLQLHPYNTLTWPHGAPWRTLAKSAPEEVRLNNLGRMAAGKDDQKPNRTMKGWIVTGLLKYSRNELNGNIKRDFD